MKEFKDILNETKKFKKFTVSNNNNVEDVFDKLSKKLEPGSYSFEADGFKTNEADFTFKGTFKILDKNHWVLKKGKNKFFRVDGFKISPTGSGRPNTISIKDIDEIRINF